MNLLARREHSRTELFTKLRARGYTADAIEVVISRLVEENLLSDARFTEGLVRSRIAGGYGPVKIRHELRQHAIPNELIAVHLGAADSEWHDRAARARRKRFGEVVPSGDRERARQARYLQSRGFTTEQIWRELRSWPPDKGR